MVKGLVRGYLLVLVGIVATLAPFGSQGPLPTVASAAQPSDPAIGPHARDEAQHQHDAYSLTPARAGVIPPPLAVHAGSPPPLAGEGRVGALRPYALAPAGGVTREVFGFAPYWRLAQNPNWNYSLLSTVAYFGLNFNPDGTVSTNDAGWTGWNSQDLATLITDAHAAGDAQGHGLKPNRAGTST